MTKDHILQNACYRLVGTRGLRGIPHKDVLDMTAIYTLGYKYRSTVIDNETIKEAGVKFEDLDAAARVNTIKGGVVFSSIDGMLGLSVPGGSTLYVLTNKDGIYGAALLMYADLLAQAAEKVNGDFFLLPSSVHEVIILPDDGTMMQPDGLRAIVASMNENEYIVFPDDVLTDNVYRYIKETGDLKIA